MDLHAIEALSRNLEPLFGGDQPVTPPPAEETLQQGVRALQMLVFPSLRPKGSAGRTIAVEVTKLFAELIEAADGAARVSVSGSGSASGSGAGAGAGSGLVSRSRGGTEVLERFLARVPGVAERLGSDVRAAYRGDPAAHDELEIMACYPGIRALLVHRFAHELDALGVPLLPRMLAELAHRETGIDIHPSASIGDELFIDHGTGVVIGQTAVIGNRCRIYQGVTLGARSFDRDPDGSLRRGYRRHPTLEDDVTVYAGATILGGDTVIGRGSVVAGGVFLTQSVPPGHLVTSPKLQLRVLSMTGEL